MPNKKVKILITGLDPETIKRLRKDVPSRQLSVLCRWALRQTAYMTKQGKFDAIHAEKLATLQAEK